ncbi:MAG: comEC [Actinomycetia bacterium]|nr:comEC [Actinomycetes bacterium]
MSDLSTFVLCAAVCAGARLAVPVPRFGAFAVVGLALLLRRPLLLAVGAGLLASSLAVAAWAGLSPPASRSIDGVAVLVGDPGDVHGAVRVDVRLGRRRYEAWARGAAAGVLRDRLAGELVRLRGRVRPPSPDDRHWLAPRHVVAQLDVDAVHGWRPGNLATRAADGVRRTLTQGVRPLHDDERSLLLGVVLGDDSAQSDELREAFRASGLSHLMAVSGENVAFLLALASPLLRRVGLRWRWWLTLGLLAFFGLLTRWEPSVLRAGAMAALACTASTLGRPTSRLRLLALAVSGVVLVDPLLVHSLGFRLSVGATIGIALFAGPVGRRLPGPSWCTEPLAVTIAAQIGVAPVALPAFGGLPLASLPANVLAVPAAAPLTAWGLTGGVLAGVAGPPFDRWLHLPSRLLAGWLAGVARWGAGLPLGQVRAPHAAALAVGALAVCGGRWARRTRVGSARWRSWPSDRTGST